MNDTRRFLTHVIATIRYRAGNSLHNAPADFGSTRIGDGSWDALHTLSHMNDVLTWCHSILEGRQAWSTTKPESLREESERFESLLDAIADTLQSDRELDVSLERIFQGPLADVLTHTGQLASLRRLAGSPVEPQNYFLAEVN